MVYGCWIKVVVGVLNLLFGDLSRLKCKARRTTAGDKYQAR